MRSYILSSPEVSEAETVVEVTTEDPLTEPLLSKESTKKSLRRSQRICLIISLFIWLTTMAILLTSHHHFLSQLDDLKSMYLKLSE